MRKDLIIINNEKCLEKSETYYCENIEISSINDLLSKKFNVKLILRKSNINPIHRIKNNNVFACSNIFSFIKNVINIALKKKFNLFNNCCNTIYLCIFFISYII